ncbi:pyrroline-5-carboxylate reductase [Methylobacterium gregans]|uniref:Pyrroline-5-carboxylate reductase n=1 Tax=Methylobacterium gregans TaxID=374424 RepID=A0AA37HKH2_9HYPH|nr:pyrroline-5-carboxylate reductase [Methylobacterium gregans]MDQ0519729.1 pyrroline-5-carboxylate reductase [Methylobacterium gregans]GJD76888.1 Pyrroline-5-carboxylate reductase [Methylobacterium gregans]GLS56145.1 pyrroline-5-carboxylate reductase [Methylobacterium gregans]
MTAPARLPASLTLVGAGKMGGAMLTGWLEAGLDPRATTILDPAPSEAITALCAERGIALNPAEPAPAAVLVLGIKPQGLEAASAALAPLVGPDTLVLSILAGKTIADLKARLPGARAVVRAMPNLPASIGRGATGAVASPEVSADQRAVAEALLSAAGLTEWLEAEAAIDAVTAVSGSGPAYVFLLVEALAEAGVAAGLAPDIAGRLARATVTGAGALLEASPEEAAQLRRNVTSPGGTTAAALEVLMRADGLGGLMREAVAAAKRRAGELSG